MCLQKQVILITIPSTISNLHSSRILFSLSQSQSRCNLNQDQPHSRCHNLSAQTSPRPLESRIHSTVHDIKITRPYWRPHSLTYSWRRGVLLTNHDLELTTPMTEQRHSRWSDVEKHLQHNQLRERIHDMMHDNTIHTFSNIHSMWNNRGGYQVICLQGTLPMRFNLRLQFDLHDLQEFDQCKCWNGFDYAKLPKKVEYACVVCTMFSFLKKVERKMYAYCMKKVRIVTDKKVLWCQI